MGNISIAKEKKSTEKVSFNNISKDDNISKIKQSYLEFIKSKYMLKKIFSNKIKNKSMKLFIYNKVFKKD